MLMLQRLCRIMSSGSIQPLAPCMHLTTGVPVLHAIFSGPRHTILPCPAGCCFPCRGRDLARYASVERACPMCEAPLAVSASKQQQQLCMPHAGGCLARRCEERYIGALTDLACIIKRAVPSQRICMQARHAAGCYVRETLSPLLRVCALHWSYIAGPRCTARV